MRSANSHAPFLRAVRREVLQALRSTRDGEKTITSSLDHQSSRWASATFEGSRHIFAIRFEGVPAAVDAAVSRFRDGCTAERMDVDGELLADLVLVGEETVETVGRVSRSLRYEALTVQD